MIFNFKDRYNTGSITPPFLDKYKKFKGEKLPHTSILIYPYEVRIVKKVLKEINAKFKNFDNLILFEDRVVLSITSISSPNVVCMIEELRYMGCLEFINVGVAGALTDKFKIGDILLCSRALRNEGTSYHYLPPSEYSYASKDMLGRIEKIFKENNLVFTEVSTWTTDAPYRENREDIMENLEKNIVAVDMESSAIFAVGEYYNLSTASILVVSDILTNFSWKRGFDSREIEDSLSKIFFLLLKYL